MTTSDHETSELAARISQLYRRPLWLPALQSVFNLVLYSGLAWASVTSSSWALTVAVWPLMGLILAGFLNAAHDCAHGTLVDSKAANRIAGSLWCIPILTNFTCFKYFHLIHHRFTRLPGDSESLVPLKSVADYAQRIILHNPFRAPWTAMRAACESFPAYIDTEEKQQQARSDGVAVGMWLLIVCGLTVAFPLELACSYWIPFVLFGPIVSLLALPEHHGCRASSDVFVSTRSVVSNRLVRVLLWNSGFHAEHHLYPGVPSCNLRKLHRSLPASRAHYVRSYFAFHARVIRELWYSPLTRAEPS